MNILDVILIIVNIIVIFGGVALTIYLVRDECCDFTDALLTIGTMTLSVCCILFVTFVIPFVIIDKGSGSTVGEITSVDKNFFGTTSIYIKTSENSQEQYCIEDNGTAKQAKELIGSKVKVFYGSRVGIYSTGKCGQAPIAKIEVVNEE